MGATQTAVKGSTWKIDASHSHVEFAVKHLMISTVKGNFSDVEGSIVIPDSDPTHSTVNAVIRAASIDTRTTQRDDHLRGEDFLHVEQFPEITFVSKRITGDADEFKIVGDLTIRGVTREISLDATKEGAGKDPWGGERVGFSAKGKFDRREFGLIWNQVIESGGVAVGHEIKISLEVEAVKQA